MKEYKFDLTITVEAEDADDANERLSDLHDALPEGIEIQQTSPYSSNPV